MKEDFANREEGTGLVLLRKPVRRVESAQVVREATTGRVVSTVPGVAARPKPMLLPKVWAVAEAEGAVAAEMPASGLGPPEELLEAPEEEVETPAELAFYRKYTEAMLRRYVRLSMAAGRVPSLLGRELFRGHVSSYRMTNFEDVVVFCFDMEKLLGRLDTTHQQLIKRIAMQQYTQVDTASMLRVPFRTCKRMYGRALDALTEKLLEVHMLEPLKSCQGGAGEKNGPFDSF